MSLIMHNSSIKHIVNYVSYSLIKQPINVHYLSFICLNFLVYWFCTSIVIYKHVFFIIFIVIAKHALLKMLIFEIIMNILNKM